MLLLALLLMWLPSQCSFDALQFPQEKKVDLDQEESVDIDQELSQSKDGFGTSKVRGSLHGHWFHLPSQRAEKYPKEVQRRFSDWVN